MTMGWKDEEFKERLAGIGPRNRRTKRKRSLGPASAFDDLPGIAEDGVLVVERSLSELASDDVLRSILAEVDRTGRAVLARDDVDDEVRTLLRNPRGALFIDTETTGLSGSMVFLLGAMRISHGDVRLTQVFARDYSEEPALLAKWIEMLSEADMLVSFNGKAFDIPVLRDRLGFHGLERPPEGPHLDLLHHARRRWREVLPNCRLQTLEWRVCGRRRTGDIPGEEIPSIYHHFVRTGSAGDILTVFHHNALDLITLADLALALAVPEDGPA